MAAIVVASDGDAAALLETALGLVDVVALLELEGPVEVLFVADRTDPEVDRLTREVEGAVWVDCDSGDDLARRWQLGRAAASQPVAWYGRTSAGPVVAETVLQAFRSWDVEENRALPATWVNPGLSGAAVQSPRADAITAGRGTYCAPGVVIRVWYAPDAISIGQFCSIGDNVHLVHTGNGRRRGRDRDGLEVPLPSLDGHRPHAVTTFPLRLLTQEPDLVTAGTEVLGSTLTVGNDVWIGYGAVVSGPVTVGDGAVIATGAVVLNDVPPYAVVAGNPARIVRMRFSPPVVQALQRIQWWNWPEDLIAARWNELYGDIRAFVRTYDVGGPASATDEGATPPPEAPGRS